MNTSMCMNRIEEAIAYAKSEKHLTIYNWTEYLTTKTVIAFGLGKFFEDTHERLFEKADVKYLCDNDSKKWGKTYYGKKCISPEELYAMENVVVIIVMGNCSEVTLQLKEHGIECIEILEVYMTAYAKGLNCDFLTDSISKIQTSLNLLANDESRDIYTSVFCNKIYLSKTNKKYSEFRSNGEYFENGCWTLTDDEYIVDGGAYIGDTVDEIQRVTNGKYGAIYSFEYNNENYLKLTQHIKDAKYKNVTAYSYGIWDEDEEGFCKNFGATDGTEIVDDNYEDVQQCFLKPLDKVLADKKITVIKYDIEGAEVNGILGAKNIIQTQHPKLAICLYHRPEDFWEIPILIHSLVPEYRFELKHHSEKFYDTVLYASI